MSNRTAIDRRVTTMMAKKTPAERLRMASRMFDTACALVLAGAGPHGDVRALMLTRLYAADFSAEERARILTHLGRNRSGHGQGGHGDQRSRIS